MASFVEKAVDAEKAAYFQSYCEAYETISQTKTAEGHIKTEDFVKNLENRAEYVALLLLPPLLPCH